MISTTEFQKKAAKFLLSLPTMPHSSGERKAFVHFAGLPTSIVQRIDFEGSATVFVASLLDLLWNYGQLPDRRHALETVLEAAREYVGVDRQQEINSLLEELRTCLRQESTTRPSAGTQPEDTSPRKIEQPESSEEGKLAQEPKVRVEQRIGTVSDGGTVVGDVHDVQGDVYIGGQHYHPTTPPSPTPIPLQRPPRAQHFTGRAEDLAQLLAALQPGCLATLCGPGGIGKTALAAEALWTLAPGDGPPQAFPDGILFYSFYGRPDTALALEHIVRSFDEGARDTSADAAQRLLSRKRALLFLDGTEQAEDLGAVLRVRGTCGLLITTRRHQDAPASRQDVPPLVLDCAVQLLQAWAGEQAAGETAGRICELVGRCPWRCASSAATWTRPARPPRSTWPGWKRRLSRPSVTAPTGRRASTSSWPAAWSR
jgi:hypothetical protein